MCLVGFFSFLKHPHRFYDHYCVADVIMAGPDGTFKLKRVTNLREKNCDIYVVL